MSKVLRTIQGCLFFGVAFALIACVLGLLAPFIAWFGAVIRYYPHDLLIPTIGEAYESFPLGKDMLFWSVGWCFFVGLFGYPINKWEGARLERRRALARQRAAAEAQPGEAFFYYDRKVLWQLLVLSLIFVAIGLGVLFVAVSEMVESDYHLLREKLLVGFLLCGTAFASYIFLVCLRRLRHHGPALIIGAAGIWTARSGPDAIPWSEIAGVACVTGYMTLRFRPPGRLRRSLLPYQFFRTSLPWLFGHRTTKLVINLSIMSVGEEDVVLAVRKFASEMDVRAGS